MRTLRKFSLKFCRWWEVYLCLKFGASLVVHSVPHRLVSAILIRPDQVAFISNSVPRQKGFLTAINQPDKRWLCPRRSCALPQLCAKTMPEFPPSSRVSLDEKLSPCVKARSGGRVTVDAVKYSFLSAGIHSWYNKAGNN